MKKKFQTYTVPYRRKREGKTNYKKRLKLLKSSRLRLVVRRSLRYINAQVIEYNATGDKVVASASSRELAKYGWKHNTANMPAAYLTGLLLGAKAKKSKLNNLVLDMGLYGPIKGSKIFACMKGVVDAGVKIAHSSEILPSEARIKGEHIAKFNPKSTSITKDVEEVSKKVTQ